MDSRYSVDRFVAGLLFGACIAWFASVAMDHWVLPSSIGQGLGLRLAIEAVVSACLVLPRPLLLKTVFRSRRSVFIQDEDVRAMLQGRVVGILSGVWVGATINSVLFSG
ncbi:hypothetical protein B0G69_2820 [Paraburkholderia sp. RAU2J]|uniref:hypothetical protein n=1 Tax=Paraburkholderia sp. RAU2J TaxID=1938810 RepID=UPI000EADDC1A|nr:hypothetical protein [Paraburkholderia sp. RAU2J]RKT27016.1 hypothetical protein B0G69_2820 [Paraburkholderia sp. RAU2J]